MNTLAFTPSLMLMASPASRTTSTVRQEPLLRIENVVEYVGDDPDTHRQVFELCLDLIVKTLPQLCQAMENKNVQAMQHIAHYTRGSLGMLGLPKLQNLGEEIEYHHDDLSSACWEQRCEELHLLLDQLRQELNDQLAA